MLDYKRPNILRTKPITSSFLVTNQINYINLIILNEKIPFRFYILLICIFNFLLWFCLTFHTCICWVMSVLNPILYSLSLLSSTKILFPTQKPILLVVFFPPFWHNEFNCPCFHEHEWGLLLEHEQLIRGNTTEENGILSHNTK